MSEVATLEAVAEALGERVTRLERQLAGLDPQLLKLAIAAPVFAPIVADAARLTGQCPSAIISMNRATELHRARCAIIWAARTETNFTYPQIGRAMSDRDHTSIIHGFKRAQAMRAADYRFEALTDLLVSRIQERRAQP